MKMSQIKKRIACWEPRGRVMPKFSPLAVSGAEISRFQPEGHENISRSRADHEIRLSDFVSTASGGSDALFPASREQELLSGEKLAKPLPTAQTCISEDSQSEGRHSSPRYFLATPVSDSERVDQDASGNVSLHVVLDEKVGTGPNTHSAKFSKELAGSCQPLHASTQRCGKC